MDTNTVTLIVGIAGIVGGLLSAIRLASFHWGRLRRVERLVELRAKVAGSSRSLVDEMVDAQLGALKARLTRDADEIARRGGYVLGWTSIAIFFVMAATTSLWSAWPDSIVVVAGAVLLISGLVALLFSVLFVVIQTAEVIRDFRAHRPRRQKHSAASSVEVTD